MDKIKAFFQNKIVKLVAWIVLALDVVVLIIGGATSAEIGSGAVKRLGLPYIECNVVEDDLSEKEVILTQIAENVQRKNMSAFELCETFDYLKEKLHINQKAIAKMFGKSDVWVTNQYQALRMLETEYGKDIPEDEKKKSCADIKKDIAAKMGKSVEWIYCKGMKVKVVGHTYTLFPTDNKAENALRKFIEGRK